MPDSKATTNSAFVANGGVHPLRLAAEQGFGPLSDKAQQVWHGDSAPCASCARLNPREATACQHCGQNLTQDMLQRMARHSGPWFVFDPQRPFPGVSLERLLRQIERGVLTRTTLIRGPTTFYQWRYATEAPLISRFLGYCWRCQDKVQREHQSCSRCQAVLDGFYRADQPAAAVPAPLSEEAPASPELAELSRAVSTLPPTIRQVPTRDRSLGKTALVFMALAAVVVVTMVILLSIGGTVP